MKKLVLAASILAASTASAFAADLAARPYTKVPPVVAALYDWSGFYIGINGGGAWSNKCWDRTSVVAGVVLVPAVVEGCHDATGGTVGGQIGYRWQAASWVFGVEAQGNWADLSGNNNPLLFPGITNRSRIDAIGLFTGQVGYAWNNVLVYVKGGGAVVSDRYRSFDVASGLEFDRANETRWGGTVGAGVEFGFAPNWTVGFEYDHIFLGNRTIGFTGSGNFAPLGVATRSDRISQDVDIGLVRVNYRWGGPMIARY